MRKTAPLSGILILLAILSSAIAGDATPAKTTVRLAVVDFRANGAPFHLGAGVAEMVRGRLVGVPGCTVLERTQLAAVAAEHRLALSGLVDERTAVKLGKLVGARYMLLGSVNGLGSVIAISARLVDVETAVALAAFNVSSNDGENGLYAASQTLGENIVMELFGSPAPTPKE